MDPDMFDIGFCRRKEAEYYAKARTATDAALRSAYEAAAREFAWRTATLGQDGETGSECA